MEEQVILSRSSYEDLVMRKSEEIENLKRSIEYFRSTIKKLEDDMLDSDKVIWINVTKNTVGSRKILGFGIFTNSMEVKDCIKTIERRYNKKSWRLW